MVVIVKLRIENKLLLCDNFGQIIDVNNDLIETTRIIINGSNFKIKYLDVNKLVINGNFTNIKIAGDNFELQNQNEKKWFF